MDESEITYYKVKVKLLNNQLQNIQIFKEEDTFTTFHKTLIVTLLALPVQYPAISVYE